MNPDPMAGVLLSLSLTVAVLAAMLRFGWGAALLDRPNERSLHSSPVPRAGGLGMAAGIAAGVLPLWSALDGPLRLALAGCAVLALLSCIDDVRGLPAAPRLLAHVAVAAGWATGALDLAPAALVVVAVAIAWSTNLYNFMDGADGLAAGMTVSGFGALAAGLALAGASGPAALAGVVGVAGLGFLLFNFHPARVFLGDSGSIPLGFLAAALGLHGWRIGAWDLVFPLIVFLPFWLDASVTVALRTLRGERPWRAHREHFYQKAVRCGLGHRGVALRWYAAMAVCAAAALVGRTSSVGVQVFILCVLTCLAGLAAAILERRHRRTTER